MEHPATAHRAPDRPGALEMLGEIIDLSAGFGIVALPLLVTALPGVVLLLVLPAVLLAGAVLAPLAVLALLAAPPYLVVRALRRARRGREAQRTRSTRERWPA